MRDFRIVTDGPFGDAVADYIREFLALEGHAVRIAREPLENGFSNFLANADVGIRASWRDVHAEFDDFAASAWRLGCIFLPIALRHPNVRVGPVSGRGRAPCYACYSVRVRQHADDSGTPSGEVEDALATDRTLGVAGYPPHIAALAAGLALAMLGHGSGQETLPQTGKAGPIEQIGQVALIDYNTDGILRWQVTPVHMCRVCGTGADDQAAAAWRRDRARSLRGLELAGQPAEGRA